MDQNNTNTEAKTQTINPKLEALKKLDLNEFKFAEATHSLMLEMNGRLIDLAIEHKVTVKMLAATNGAFAESFQDKLGILELSAMFMKTPDEANDLFLQLKKSLAETIVRSDAQSAEANKYLEEEEEKNKIGEQQPQ